MPVSEEEYQKHIQEKNHHQVASKFSEIILGGQDGLVNTLGVILGISAATSDIRIILAGGLAAAVAESISMAAVAYTSKLADYEYYTSQLNKEINEIKEIPEIEKEEVRRILMSWDLSNDDIEKVISVVEKNEKFWIEMMMSHELGLAKVEKEKPTKFSITVGISAIIGSLIPIIPFLFLRPNIAWIFSLIVSAFSLFIVGFIKSKFTIGNPFKGGLKLLIIGVVSALAGYFIGKIFGQV